MTSIVDTTRDVTATGRLFVNSTEDSSAGGSSNTMEMSDGSDSSRQWYTRSTGHSASGDGQYRPVKSDSGPITTQYRSSRGEHFATREARISKDKKKVTYILQTSGQHDDR